MRRAITICAFTILAVVFISIPAEASGHVRLNNETNVAIHPWFKSSCWRPELGFPSGWVFFGGVGPRGTFQWDHFNDLLIADCGDVQFTYTLAPVPAPEDPVQGNHRARFTVTPEENIVLQVGEGVRAIELEGPGETGR